MIKYDEIDFEIFWFEDGSLEDLPDPDTFFRDIAENLESALEQFKGIYEDLEEKS